MRYLILLIAVLLVPVTVHAQWANKPVGLTTVFDCPYSDTVCNMHNVYNTLPFASPGGSPTPLSPPRALNYELAVNATTGNGQWIWYLDTPREAFVGAWWSTNADFQGITNNNNKMLFVRNPNIDNNFIVWQGLPDQPRTLKWYLQATYDNCHVSGYEGGCFNQGDGTGWLNPNVNSGAATVSAGTGWHKIELYLKASTSNTSRDGIVRMWVDGNQTHNYTNVNLTPAGFVEFQINTAWDNSASFQCSVRDCSRAWHHYYDHIFIATDGGGSPTPTAPAAPSNLRFDSPTPPLPPTAPSNLRFDSPGVPSAPSDLRYGASVVPMAPSSLRFGP